MKRITVLLFAALLVLTTVTASIPARTDAWTEGVKEYTCELDYPDGTFGVAVVKVIISGGKEAAAPTVMVTVDYYSEGREQYLGRYEDWSNSSDFPDDEYEAEAFALKHFPDRW